jgi:hypothetical protein
MWYTNFLTIKVMLRPTLFGGFNLDIRSRDTVCNAQVMILFRQHSKIEIKVFAYTLRTQRQK